MKQAKARNRNIHTMYVDYKKAFNYVPHSWQIFMLEHYRIHPILVSFISTAMLQWETRPERRGIFQSHAFSPLWFCLALNPLSKLLNNTNIGFKLNHNSSFHTLLHLLYMDDIKIYATNNTELLKLADITQIFLTDIQMQFAVDKCRILSINRSKTIKKYIYTHYRRTNIRYL